jgi:inner membrane protein
VPSLIAHAVVGAAAAVAVASPRTPVRVWPLAVVCAMLPDGDVGAFGVGIPYGHPFGHRGFFHSPFFACLLAAFVVAAFFRDERAFGRRWWGLLGFFAAVGASHGVLDAFTNGGRGIALLAPFSWRRFFAPWRPIVVSPIGLDEFLSEWGVRVLASELVWVVLPACALALLVRLAVSRSGTSVVG